MVTLDLEHAQTCLTWRVLWRHKRNTNRAAMHLFPRVILTDWIY